MSLSMENGKRGLNRDTIKYFAMLAMLLNHIATIFLQSGTVLCELFLNIGYFTGITMCYFLVEGYRYTRSKTRYFLRLLTFAIISEFPYCFAFSQDTTITFYGMNMLFTLCLCFILIAANRSLHSRALYGCIIIVVIALSFFCSWAVMAPLFTLLFLWSEWSDGNRDKTKIAFFVSAVLFGALNLLGGLGRFPASINVLYAVLSMLGIGFSGVCIICCYSGERTQRGRQFSKWFFYLFYPLHLLALGLIRLYLQ